ncbi:MAG: hypothetical protein RXP28_05300 [Nitrososphaeria archaeon]|jgi:hypothetical protein
MVGRLFTQTELFGTLMHVEQIDQGVINGSIQVPYNPVLPPSGAV